jgi:hypothetical protein
MFETTNQLFCVNMCWIIQEPLNHLLLNAFLWEIPWSRLVSFVIQPQLSGTRYVYIYTR